MTELKSLKKYLAERDKIKNRIAQMRSDLMRAESKVQTLNEEYQELVRDDADNASLQKTFRELQAAKANQAELAEMVRLAESAPIHKPGQQDPKPLIDARSKVLAEAGAIISEKEEKREKILSELENLVKDFYSVSADYGLLLCEEQDLQKQIEQAGINTKLNINPRHFRAMPAPDVNLIGQEANKKHGIFWL